MGVAEPHQHRRARRRRLVAAHGRTPWSRTADGRLTLKGGVREVLATTMLEALGVEGRDRVVEQAQQVLPVVVGAEALEGADADMGVAEPPTAD
jgi:hypothetical protein